LQKVEAKLPSGVVVARVKFDHDLSIGTSTPPTLDLKGQCDQKLPAASAVKRGNLLYACRSTRPTTLATDASRPDLQWAYTYADPKGRNLEKIVSSNEMQREVEELLPTSSTNLVFEASYKRELIGDLTRIALRPIQK
jgi:hypothetical protein